MKMTRLEWRYLQRIALDHPYYDTHKPPLSDAEAKAIMEANNTMTGREFVDSIYAKLGMTRPVKEKKRLAWLSNIGELFTVPPIRKVAIAILVVLLMTVFFAATPTGRAIAESVIQYITTLFEDGKLSVNRSNNDVTLAFIDSTYTENDGIVREDLNDIAIHEMHISTFDEFTKATGRNPFVLPLLYTELYYTYDEVDNYLDLSVTYETVKGTILSFQIWNVEDLATTTSTGFMTYDADEAIYYSIEEQEGYIYCQKVLQDSIITISSNGLYTLDELIHMLKNE